MAGFAVFLEVLQQHFNYKTDAYSITGGNS